MKTRCAWVKNEPLYQDYHDKEWGIPVYDDRLLFEFLILEGMQAGLNWLTVLKKRENFRRCFDNFEAKRIAQYDEQKFNQLMAEEGIIRNRLKIKAAIQNAQSFLKVQEEFGDFATYIWAFVQHNPLQNHWSAMGDVPASTAASDALAKDLKKRGFKFVGTTICYAFMQAIGMVNDHTTDCFCHARVQKMSMNEKL